MSLFGRVCLVQVLRPDGQIRAHLIDKPAFTVGRSNSADVPTLSPAASREHLHVEITDEGVMMTDLGSANGTFINGERMEAQTPYAVDAISEIRLGTSDEVISFYSFPRPLEMTDMESQKIQLRASVGEVIKYIEETSLAEQESRLARIRQQGIQEVSQIKRVAEDEGHRALRESKIEAQRIVDAAMVQAQEIIEKGNRDSLDIYEQKVGEAEKRKREIEEKMLDFQKEVAAHAAKMKRDAQKQAEEMMNEAHAKSRALNEKADERMAHLTEEAQLKSVEILKSAEQQAESAILQAHQESHRILSEAQEKARITRETTQERSDELLRSAKAKAEQLLITAQADLDAKLSRTKEANEDLIKKAKEMAVRESKSEKKKILDEARFQATEAQEKVISDYKTKVDEQRKALEKANHELDKVTRKQSEIVSHISKFESEREAVMSDVERLRLDLAQLQKDTKEAQDLVAQMSESEKRRAQADAEFKQVTKKIELLKLDFENAKTAGDKELRAHLDSLIVVKKESDQSLDAEMKKDRLRALGELQRTVEAEEKRIKELRKHQVHDIAKSLEVKIVEHLEKAKSSQQDINVALIGSDIFKFVAEALVVDVSKLEVTTAHGHDLATGKKAERIKHTKLALAAAGVVFIMVLGIFREKILGFFRAADENGFMARVTAERKARAVFNPQMTDDFKSTYADNVIFTRGYYETKTDPEILEKWTRKLTDLKLVKKLGLAEEDLIKFIAGEVNMVRRLGAMKETIDAVYLDTELERIHKSESDDVAHLTEVLKGDENFQHIKALEREFFLFERRPAAVPAVLGAVPVVPGGSGPFGPPVSDAVQSAPTDNSFSQ